MRRTWHRWALGHRMIGPDEVDLEDGGWRACGATWTAIIEFRSRILRPNPDAPPLKRSASSSSRSCLTFTAQTQPWCSRT